ncbi:MAG: helix-turn-helix domain-containing protein [Nanoarchaeota archaeon]|nr:helix-turn-helix domain-containing protein [Nanoarchaeota archaeon]
MSKSNFLLVDLNEPKVKKLAETITSETSRKILNHLAEKEDTEQNISKVLAMPISTVHYHLQKLQEAELVKVDEYHYSPKGREVNHYKLANKYIIIAPQKVAGLREKLKGILPVGLIILGVSAVIEFVSRYPFQGPPEYARGYMAADSLAMEVAPAVSSEPNITLWFLMGGLGALGLYVLYQVLKDKLLNR